MISLKLKNKKLKKGLKKYKNYVKYLKQENQSLLNRVRNIGIKISNIMVKFTKEFRFNQKLKEINENLLNQEKIWKEECKQQREKTAESNKKLRILTDLGMHVLQDTMQCQNRPLEM